MTFVATEEVLVGLGSNAEVEPHGLRVSDRARSIAVTALLVAVQAGWLGTLLGAAYFFIHASN